jgi:hypothetical protein
LFSSATRNGGRRGIGLAEVHPFQSLRNGEFSLKAVASILLSTLLLGPMAHGHGRVFASYCDELMLMAASGARNGSFPVDSYIGLLEFLVLKQNALKDTALEDILKSQTPVNPMEMLDRPLSIQYMSKLKESFDSLLAAPDVNGTGWRLAQERIRAIIAIRRGLDKPREETRNETENLFVPRTIKVLGEEVVSSPGGGAALFSVADKNFVAFGSGGVGKRADKKDFLTIDLQTYQVKNEGKLWEALGRDPVHFRFKERDYLLVSQYGIMAFDVLKGEVTEELFPAGRYLENSTDGAAVARVGGETIVAIADKNAKSLILVSLDRQKEIKSIEGLGTDFHSLVKGSFGNRELFGIVGTENFIHVVDALTGEVILKKQDADIQQCESACSALEFYETDDGEARMLVSVKGGVRIYDPFSGGIIKKKIPFSRHSPKEIRIVEDKGRTLGLVVGSVPGKNWDSRITVIDLQKNKVLGALSDKSVMSNVSSFKYKNQVFITWGDSEGRVYIGDPFRMLTAGWGQVVSPPDPTSFSFVIPFLTPAGTVNALIGLWDGPVRIAQLIGPDEKR